MDCLLLFFICRVLRHKLNAFAGLCFYTVIEEFRTTQYFDAFEARYINYLLRFLVETRLESFISFNY